MYTKSEKIQSRNGLHIRLSAMLVNKAAEISRKYNVSLYIRKPGMEIPFAFSILAVISLKISQNEEVEILSKTEDENSINAVNELILFIKNELKDSENRMDKIDDILVENNIAKEQIIESVPIGIIVTDQSGNIININKYSLNILNMEPHNVLGKFIKEINPSSELIDVMINNNNQRGKIEYINSHITFVNRSPIINKNVVIGAIETYQDISELVGMKELNEKFIKILETSHDLICFIDENRKVSYVNPSYENYYNIKSKDILNKNLLDIYPSELELEVFNKRKSLSDIIYKKNNIEAIFSVEPIYIDNIFKGVISIAKPVNEIKEFMAKLEKSKEEINYYKEELRRTSNLGKAFYNIIGQSESLKDCLYIAEKASNSISTVLIRGESGTGKELIAIAIHNNSARKDNPFVRVNCAAIPENLIESELFGYEKGAFTGAYKNKPGKFLIANGGTIFLDEIGDMPLSMQVKLLRVLQEREFESVGGIITHKVDVRIVAATNRNLEEMIENGEFRNDLYYRLNVLSILLPPLKKRKEDLNLLVEHFIKKISNKLQRPIPKISPSALNLIHNYDFPGNIRELENIIERAINMCDGLLIKDEDLPLYLYSSDDKSNLINLRNGELLTFQEYEKEIIEKAMKKYKSYNKAGKALGLTHRTISLKCEKYSIKRED
ncbi:MAG: sigma 54-interacting transcriptional regulator [Clostridiaceae bacterium]